MKLYASLVGPLLGLYLEAPDEVQTPNEFSAALTNSKLRYLWCSIYTREQVERQIKDYGGAFLPSENAAHFWNDVDSPVASGILNGEYT